MSTHDYGSFSTQETGSNIMPLLISAADRMEALEKEIEELENLLAVKKEAYKGISEKEIPEIVDGLEGKLNLPDGRVVVTEEKIRASVSEANKDTAYKYIEDSGRSSLIKRKFTIEFGRDQEAWAKKFEADLKKRKIPLNVKRTKEVHYQTMLAFVKEALAEGEDIPYDVFGIFRQRVSKIKR